MTPTRPETAVDRTAVRVSVDVAAPVAHVFDVFTLRMDSWWDPGHHLLEDWAEFVVEPRVGGAITDVGPAGERCTWGRVLVFDRPAAFAFSWDITPRWEVETDPARCSEVHVAFTALDARRTRVVLEHRHLDRHGDGWTGMRDSVGSDRGWGSNLRRMADVAAG